MKDRKFYSLLVTHMAGRDFTEVLQHMDDEFVDWVDYVSKWFTRNVEHAVDTMDEATGADHELFYNICINIFYQVINSDYIPTREGLVKQLIYMLDYFFQIADAICECE